MAIKFQDPTFSGADIFSTSEVRLTFKFTLLKQKIKTYKSQGAWWPHLLT